MTDPLVFARAVHLAATMLATGVVFFSVFVSEPALVTGAPVALQARLRAQARVLLACGLAVAVVSGAVWFGLLAARIGEAASLDELGEAALTLLTQTEFGTTSALRLVLALLLAAAVMRRDVGDARANFTLVAAALFAGALAWSGHGAATPGEPGAIHVVADVIHLTAAAAWLGSLVPLALLLRVAPTDPLGVAALARMLRRYTPLGTAAVGGLILSGIVNVLFVPGKLSGWITSEYGRVLAAKLALFAIMVAIAAVNRAKLVPALAASQGDAAAQRDDAVRRLRVHILAEIALGLAIVMLVAWLGIMVPGAPMHDHVH
ncbi:MAG: copper homeostasis membrane protein CopD [Alphaproteobacteria bacterium]|nr:copper homeostasis membrane protein CopD [Alphaproteobacteria bacterium]